MKKIFDSFWQRFANVEEQAVALDEHTIALRTLKLRLMPAGMKSPAATANWRLATIQTGVVIPRRLSIFVARMSC